MASSSNDSSEDRSNILKNIGTHGLNHPASIGGKRQRIEGLACNHDGAREGGDDDDDEKHGALRNDSHSASLKEVIQQSINGNLSQEGKPQALESSTPYAPQLADYLAPGGASRFLPRPEWYLSEQHQNQLRSIRSSGRKRPRESSASLQQNQAEAAAASENPIPPPARLAAAAVNRNDDNGDQASAPDDGLLPYDTFTEYQIPSWIIDQNEQERGTTTARTAAAIHAAATAAAVAAAAAAAAAAVTSHGNDPEESSEDTEEEYITKVPAAPLEFGRDCDSALQVAIRENSTIAALQLIQMGASVHFRNAKRVTPLILASQKGNLPVVEMLLKQGANPMDSSITGSTALLQASHFGHVRVVRLLLQNGASTEMASQKNTTPLMRAAQEGHENVVRTLLTRGAKINRRNNDHMTAVMLASQRGHANVVQMLLDWNADIDAMTEQNSTSLMLACKRENTEVVRVLLTEGCELMMRDSRGRTARDVAFKKGCKELLRLLDPAMQTRLMQHKFRRIRSYEIVKIWTLLQQERADVPLPDGTLRTIHDVMRDSPLLQNMGSSRAALVRTMTLPIPMVEQIASYMPRPRCWEQRLSLLLKRCSVDPDSSVACSLDLIDEVLEDGGFIEACDTAGVTAPTNFNSWVAWRSWIKQLDNVIVDSPRVNPSRRHENVLTATLPGLPHWEPTRGPASPSSSAAMVGSGGRPPQTTALEQRRGMCFLQLLAHRSPVLGRVLSMPPYNMPRQLIQELITVNDVQSLSRRLGSKGVRFAAALSMEMVMLASSVCSWYNRERDDSSLSNNGPCAFSMNPGLMLVSPAMIWLSAHHRGRLR